MKHIFHAEAADELASAISFYEGQAVGLGAEFDEQVRRAIRSIKESPDRWPLLKGGVRRCLVERFPYAIRYLVKSDCIFIVAVAHGKRKPEYWSHRVN